MRVLIMAHGNQTRIDHPRGRRKARLSIDGSEDGETIIDRSIRLAAPIGEVSVWAPLDGSYADCDAQIWSCARPGDSLAAHLRTAFPLWQRGALILLGDVVFSARLMQRMAMVRTSIPLIFGRKGPNTWTGKSYGECYAVVVPHRESAEFLLEALPPEGKLWDVLASLGNTSHDGSSRFFREVTDFTDDIDTPEDIDHILPVLRRLIVEEKP